MASRNRQAGFTLIELLVVIAIIALISTIALVAVNNARKRARDVKRLADFDQLRTALELYYNDYNQFPFVNNGNGIVIGDNNAFAAELTPYLPDVPIDELYDGTTGNEKFFYGYDETHNGCRPDRLGKTTGPAMSINRFETESIREEYAHQDTNSGGDVDIDTADHNICLMGTL